ncbi:MAG TPA: rRNA maturation RNase YbeY [Anaerolineales bacterium]|nr:rRNA maturation RNase YbeY [Anaerolineales bacterium]
MSVFDIRIDHPQAAGLDESGIRRAAAAALEAAGAADNVEAALILAGDADLRRLNRDFRGVDQVTDVLAFPDGGENPENGLLYLGDVVIAYPSAALQAQEAGHSPGDEIQLLVIHGLLHLLGYNHDGREENARMWEIQKRALSLIESPIKSEDWE